MSIIILSACTGRGHNSVMNTLFESFCENGYSDCICFPDYYESILPSNRLLSDFYNFLLTNSSTLCEKYVQFNTLTRPDTNDDIYNLTKKHYFDLFNTPGLEAIISTATSINFNLIRALKEKRVYGKVPFYIVVTDPYDPIAPGFNVIGATRYFCANKLVQDILVQSGIEYEKIMVTGYPVSKRFLRVLSPVQRDLVISKMKFDVSRKVILLNCGSQGSMSSLNLLRGFLESGINANLIMLCGKNKSLYRLARIEVKKFSSNNVRIMPFYNSIEELLAIADVYVTKAGANSFYEALSSRVPILIDATDGYLYQERGVIKVMDELNTGMLMESANDFAHLLSVILKSDVQMEIKQRYMKLNIQNGAERITGEILSEIKAGVNKSVKCEISGR